MTAIFMMSAHLAALDIIKINFFEKKGYGIIYSVHDVTNKVFTRKLNYIVDVVIWPKFGYPSISMRKLIISSTL